MAESAPCQQCGSLDVTFRHLVERSYLHPVMGVILGIVTGAFFAVNTGNLLATALVAVGIAAFPLLVPVTRRIIGHSYTCTRCGHRWIQSPRPRVPQPSHD
jgi:hypothetical protein